MTMVLAITVAVTFAVSIYLMLGRELKGVAMGVFLLSHAANLSILTMSGSPVMTHAQQEVDARATELHTVDSPMMKDPPILPSQYSNDQPLATMVDPLPQALILTAIVISFGVMAFLLTLLVVTNRKTDTIEVADLAEESRNA
ncbi:MAG: sodium:proton antiporter [Planctomycetota bacterium]